VIVDDNRTTWGRYLHGIKIGGGRNDILRLCEKYEIDRIIFAIPSAPVKDRREILNICSETGCKLQAIPGLSQIVDGVVSIAKLRDVNLEDLLERDEIKVNNQEILQSIKGKVIMVTGGGGSIGSELCRQIAAASPSLLVIFDIYENNAYDIQQELRRQYGDKLDLLAVIASVRDKERIYELFDTLRPDVVFHAAAHKQVPLLESCPGEAVRNNLLGTYNAACAAVSHGCRKFILLSTDKAVNPTSVLGVTSRVGEMLMQVLEHLARSRQLRRLFPPFGGADPGCATEFASVRFGSVFDSQGSAMGLFKHQIAAGGPVLVTHREATRFCMSTAETARLLLQAACYARDGEVFVLDMGKPVRIDDMARKMIRLSGFEPDVDIKIVYTGLRPGEKLYEEMLMKEEGLRTTDNELIHIGKPLDIDEAFFRQKLVELEKACEENSDDIFYRVAEIVKTYKIAPCHQTVKS
jgi:FlaA1/EpsC-like NDP-sugar epimerase